MYHMSVCVFLFYFSKNILLFFVKKNVTCQVPGVTRDIVSVT